VGAKTGWWSRRGNPVVAAAVAQMQTEQAETFAVGDDMEPEVAQAFGLDLGDTSVANVATVSRKQALSVPAVKGGRDFICNSLGGLPLHLLDAEGSRIASSLFEQPEPDVPRSVTMSRTFEDMLFESRAWWRVLDRDWRGYPVSVRRLDARSVSVRRDGKVYVSKGGMHSGTAQEWVADRDLIRFDSPTCGLLSAGARAIRTCLLLDEAARRNADGVPPMEVFTAIEGADPDEDEVEAAMEKYNAAKKKRAATYIGGVKHNLVGWNPDQLQMADQRQHAVLEIARLLGLDPEDVGVSTTSRTYLNGDTRRQDRITRTLGPYASAVEDRLRMGDVTPRGQIARFDFGAFLRPDDKTRFEAYEIGLRIGATTRERVAQAEGLPVEQVRTPDNIRSLPAPEEATA
jgi:hypothetical protein